MAPSHVLARDHWQAFGFRSDIHMMLPGAHLAYPPPASASSTTVLYHEPPRRTATRRQFRVDLRIPNVCGPSSGREAALHALHDNVLLYLDSPT